MKEIVVGVVFALCIINSVWGYDYLGTCATLSNSSVCRPYLSYDTFYLASNTTQASIESTVSGYFSYLDLTNSDCKSKASAGFCLQYFRPCTEENYTVEVALASFPCRSLCEEVYEACIDFVSVIGLSCTDKSSDGFDLYPVSATVYDTSPYGGPSNVTIACSGGDLVQDTNTTVSCPYPLVTVSDEDKKNKGLYYFLTDSSNCALPCPFPFYTESQLNVIDITNKIFYPISFAGCVFLLLTYLVVTNETTHRMEIICYSAICLLCPTIAWFFDISGPNHTYTCSHDPGRYKVQADGTCGLSGVIFQFAGVGSTIWITVMSVDVYLTSRLKGFANFRIFKYITWAAIVLFTTIPAMGSAYESSIIGSGCWIGTTKSQAYQYLFFYIPAWVSAITFFITNTLFTIQIFKIYRITPNKSILFFNIKTIVLLFLLLFEFAFISVFKLYAEQHEDKFKNIISDWVMCIAVSDQSSCSLDLPFFKLRYLDVLCISLAGTFLFLGWGLEPNVLRIYQDSKRVQWLMAKLGIKWGTQFNNNFEDTTKGPTTKKSKSVELSQYSTQLSSDITSGEDSDIK